MNTEKLHELTDASFRRLLIAHLLQIQRRLVRIEKLLNNKGVKK
jgi:hypothetical protein